MQCLQVFTDASLVCVVSRHILMSVVTMQLLCLSSCKASEAIACLQIFGLMNLIIHRLGDSIKPFAEGLLQLLPEVRQDAEGQSLLRIQVSPAFRQLQSFLTQGHAHCIGTLCV